MRNTNSNNSRLFARVSHLPREEQIKYVKTLLTSRALPFAVAIGGLGLLRYRKTRSLWSLAQPAAAYLGLRALSAASKAVGSTYTNLFRDDLIYPAQFEAIEIFIDALTERHGYEPLPLWKRRYMPEKALIHALAFAVELSYDDFIELKDVGEPAKQAAAEIMKLRRGRRSEPQADRASGSDDYARSRQRSRDEELLNELRRDTNTDDDPRDSFPFGREGINPDTPVPGYIVAHLLEQKAREYGFSLDEMGIDVAELSSTKLTLGDIDTLLKNGARNMMRSRGFDRDDNDAIVTGEQLLSAIRSIGVDPSMLGLDAETLRGLRVPLSELQDFLMATYQRARRRSSDSNDGPSRVVRGVDLGEIFGSPEEPSVRRYTEGDRHIVEFTMSPDRWSNDDSLPAWLQDTCAMSDGTTECCGCGKPPCDECGGCHNHCPHHRARLESIFGGMGNLVDLGNGMMAVDMYGQGEEGLRSKINDLLGGPEGLRELRNAASGTDEDGDYSDTLIRSVFGDRRAKAGTCPQSDGSPCCPCGYFCDECGGCHSHCGCDDEDEQDLAYEPQMTPFTLADLGLSDDEIAALERLDDPRYDAPTPAEQAVPTLPPFSEHEFTPFSLADLGLSDDEIAALGLAPDAPVAATEKLELDELISAGWSDTELYSVGFDEEAVKAARARLAEAKLRSEISFIMKQSPAAETPLTICCGDEDCQRGQGCLCEIRGHTCATHDTAVVLPEDLI